MKKEIYTCDVCGNETNYANIFKAELKVEKAGTYKFDVCSTCWTATPKGVFQKAFNALIRFLGGQHSNG